MICRLHWNFLLIVIWLIKAGIIEEMMEDTLEGLEDTEELEEAAQEEVDKVFVDPQKGCTRDFS